MSTKITPTDVFAFRKVGVLTPGLQITMIVGLFLLLVAWGYWQFKETGLIYRFAVPPSAAMMYLFAPLYEEVLFRGYVLLGLIEQFGRKKALLVSAVLFGLWHLKNVFVWSPELLLHQVLYATFFIAPLFNWIVLKTKSIWLGVILHYLNNIIAYLFLPYTSQLLNYLQSFLV